MGKMGEQEGKQKDKKDSLEWAGKSTDVTYLASLGLFLTVPRKCYTSIVQTFTLTCTLCS